VLDEQTRVIIFDTGQHQAIGIRGIGRRDNLDARHMRKPGLEVVGMLPATAHAGAGHGADHERHLRLTT